ncbi:LamG-like jellyroll fold domain-containing protein [Planctomycetota bacterium]
MKWFNDYRMRLVLVGFVAAIVFSGSEIVKADFTFGEPTNLGSNVNSSVEEGGPSISADGLCLYFYDFLKGLGNGTLRMATRETIEAPWEQAVSFGPPYNYGAAPCISGDELSIYLDAAGAGGSDIFVSKRPTVSDPWGEPVNLGPNVNSSFLDMGASISADELELYFGSLRIGGSGDWDIYVTRRTTLSSPWSTAENLGPTVNSAGYDGHPCISRDGLTLFITSARPGGYGDWDIWMSRRATKDDDWSKPVNLGRTINTWAGEGEPSISADGRTLYFSDWMTPRPGGVGEIDLWQAPILPVVDFNGDAIVDAKDVMIMMEHWGENYPLCDIGPTPLGDGIVDVQDLVVLTEYIEPIDRTLIAHWALDEIEGDIAQDSAGNDDDALVIGGPIWRPNGGKVGGALLFDGNDDYVNTPFILNPGEVSFSVTTWIRSGAPGTVIISQADAEGQSAIESGGTWLGIDPSDGRLMTGLMDIFFGPLDSESVVTDGQWHHVGLVYDWTEMKRHLYVDGAEVAVDAGAVGGVQSTAGLYIGAGQILDAGSFFSGLIDDVRIYNRVLTSEDIEVFAQ